MPVLTVEAIMTAKVFTVHVSMTLREAILVLVKNKIHGAPVVDSSNTVVSVVSEGDLLRLATQKGMEATIGACLKEIVDAQRLIVAHRHDTFQSIYKLFLAHSVHRIIVIDNNWKLQGIVSRSNMLRLLVQAR